jgi:hypothetical protein
MFSIVGHGDSDYRWSELLPTTTKIPTCIYLKKRPPKEEHCNIVMYHSPYMSNYRNFDHHWAEFKQQLYPYKIIRITYNMCASRIDINMELDQILDYIGMMIPHSQWDLSWDNNNCSVLATNGHLASVFIHKHSGIEFTEQMVVITQCGKSFCIGDFERDYSYENRYAVAYHEMIHIIAN